MAVIDFESLRAHHGHRVQVAVYGDDDRDTKATIECHECRETILSVFPRDYSFENRPDDE